MKRKKHEENSPSKEVEEILNPKEPTSESDEGEDLFDNNYEKYSV